MRCRNALLATSALLLTGFVACTYNPSVHPDTLKCNDDNGCPSGYRCVGVTVERSGVCCNKPDAAMCLGPAGGASTDVKPADAPADGIASGDGSGSQDLSSTKDAPAERPAPDTNATDHAEVQAPDSSSPGFDAAADLAADQSGTGGTEDAGDFDTPLATGGVDAMDAPVATGGTGGGGISGSGGTTRSGGTTSVGGTTAVGGTTNAGGTATGGAATGGTSAGGTSTGGTGGVGTGGVGTGGTTAVCQPSPSQCSVGGVPTTGTFCSGTSIFTCSRDTNQCLVATTPSACPSGLVCGGSAGSATCRCAAPPGECMGATSGNVCQSATSYVTCGVSGQGCVEVTNSSGTCPGGSKSCAGAPGAGACTCNTIPPAVCYVAGVFTAGYACSGSDRLQCFTDTNSCPTAGAPTSCPSPQTCQGAFPSAACACPSQYNPPECDAVGELNGSRCTGSTLLACSDAGAGCQTLTTTVCTAAQMCVGAYPSARCADEQKRGWWTAGGGQQTWSNLIVGVKINVPVASTLRRLGLVWNGNGGGAALSRLATFGLYRDGGSGPSGNVLASAVDRPLNAIGPVDFNLSYPAGGSSLAAGDYWLFVNLNGAGYVANNTSPSTPYLYATNTYGSGFPDPITPAALLSDSLPGPLDVYLVVIPQQ